MKCIYYHIILLNSIKNVNEYNTLINKAQTYQQGFDLFEEMKKAGLTPDVVTFSILLKKATRHQQPLQVFLSLLDDMINLKIKPEVGQTKKAKKSIPTPFLPYKKHSAKTKNPTKRGYKKNANRLKNRPTGYKRLGQNFFRQTVVNG
jgi:hypothetical protein